VSCDQVKLADVEGAWVAASSSPVSDLKFPLRAKIGAETIVIHKTKHGFRAMDKSCPHQGASWMLGDLLRDETMIKCPLHAYAFRLSDGKGVNCPGFRMKIFDVKEIDGCLYVRAPNHAVMTGQ
jgi:nitrite reductase/ring-hydroxylating ferredoxin subunit